MSFKITWSFFLLVFLAGCAAPAVTLQPTLQVWRVQHTPAIGWMDKSINKCILEQPGAGVFLSEVTAAELDPQEADLSLTWGTAPEEELPVFQLGNDSLTVIVNPQNPLKAVNTEQLNNIVTGKWTNWQQADASLSGEIAWWLLPPGDEARLLLENALQVNLQLNPYAWLAPDPSAVLQSVAADPLAIGVVPSRWVDASVKTVPFEGIEENALTLPILAITRQQPDNELTAFLACLQTSLFTK